MPKLFSNKRLIVILISFILATASIAFSIRILNYAQTPPYLLRITDDVISVSGYVVNEPSSLIKNGFKFQHELISTYDENKRLKKQIDELQQNQAKLAVLKRENKELKKELQLNATLSDYSQITAAVISRSPSNWQDLLIINRGSVNGVKKNMPVMSGSGVIGRVMEVNDFTSKVELISSNSKLANHFAAQITNDSGEIINGVITGFSQSEDALVFGDVSSNAQVKVGDSVLTSGLGGVVPKGLLIGKVSKVEKKDYGLSTMIYVKSATNIDDFSVVTVIDRTVGD
ncbi:rod shape-determining protein MreC [Xylocopilactobacillus apicola]|uniref:Cell shape-determining protein MreC n=1 Tax=Xylocopilactobacillus apicola TaxID=2932184 RepID=A0AAU9D7K3_9LACO|nr:rod shape-determining protein MreC [Xylocopilactobacillus apicola]BDR58295.1 cell shape-determining protein MreC [Xylocopilactobacillus apicola]